MKRKIKKELKEFLEFKKKYKFKPKEITEENGNLYCEGILLKEGENPEVGESEKWINVGYKLKGDFSQMLSNLFPYEFTFRGKKFHSIENFFQGIKFPVKKVQNYVFSYYGTQAVHLKAASNYDWKKTGILYFQGNPIERNRRQYELLIDELYISAIQNPIYRGLLLNCDRPIIHSMGEVDKAKTTFTRYEFEFQLNCLKDFLQEKHKK